MREIYFSRFVHLSFCRWSVSSPPFARRTKKIKKIYRSLHSCELLTSAGGARSMMATIFENFEFVESKNGDARPLVDRKSGNSAKSK